MSKTDAQRLEELKDRLMGENLTQGEIDRIKDRIEFFESRDSQQ